MNWSERQHHKGVIEQFMAANPAPEPLIAPDTRISVEHTVMFNLGEDDQFVVPRGDKRGFVRVDGITVHLRTGGHGGNSQRVWAGGIVCKSDGTLSARWGRTAVSVDLPNPAVWIERAARHIDGPEFEETNGLLGPSNASKLLRNDGDENPCPTCGHPAPDHYAWSTACAHIDGGGS